MCEQTHAAGVGIEDRNTGVRLVSKVAMRVHRGAMCGECQRGLACCDERGTGSVHGLSKIYVTHKMNNIGNDNTKGQQFACRRMKEIIRYTVWR